LIHLEEAFSKIWNPLPRIEVLLMSGMNIKYSELSLKTAVKRSQSMLVLFNNSTLYAKEEMGIGKVAHFINSLSGFNKQQISFYDIITC